MKGNKSKNCALITVGLFSIPAAGWLVRKRIWRWLCALGKDVWCRGLALRGDKVRRWEKSSAVGSEAKG